MIKALDIANELALRTYQKDDCDPITNLKMQKLLYYEQGFHLAYFNSPLFNDDIEAWQYGPVVPSVYYHYEKFGRNGIVPETEKHVKFTSKEEEALFNEVYRVYGKYSASGLVNMTHNEAPWKSVPIGIGHIIPKDSMTEFFKTRITE